MKIISIHELDNHIELNVSDGINNYMHLVNIENKQLISKKQITIIEYNKIVKNCIIEAMYNKVLNKLSYRKRSKNYVCELLDKILPAYKYVEYIIDRLVENMYIDDLDYAKSYVKDMIYISKYGPSKIEYNLKKECISEEVINSEIKVYSSELIYSNIDFYITKYLKNNKDSYLMFKNKSINRLITKGYNIDDIVSYFNSNNIVIYEEILIKNYIENNKIDIEKLKGRLITRGFDIDKVVELIEENKKKKTLL